MKRRCVNCPKVIEVPDLHTKYCSECKIITHRENQRDWKKRNYKYKPKRNLLFCVTCFKKLPERSHEDRKYCINCLAKKRNVLWCRTYQRRKIEVS